MISIIVPVYKAENRIKLCVESVLAQTYEDYELILVDDGSPDASGTICDEYAKTDMRIKVIHKKNGGASHARNCGIKQARGEYITFLDSDDTLDREFLFKTLEYIGQNDIYISGIKMVGGQQNADYIPRIAEEISISELYEKIFVDIPQICVSGPWCKLFKRNIIVDNNIAFNPMLRCGEDTDFNLTYMRFAKSAYVDNHSYYNYYRDNSDSLFSSYNPQYYTDHVHVYDKWLQLIIDLNCSEQTIEIFYKEYINALIGNIHSAFLHNRSKAEKKEIINILSKDKMVKFAVKIKGKNFFIKWLLKNRCKILVYWIFKLKYGDKERGVNG